MKIALIIAHNGFKDEEYFVIKETLEEESVEVLTFSDKVGLAIGSSGGEAMAGGVVSNVIVDDFNAIVFIGGPGALDCLDNEDSYALVKKVLAIGKILGAICIAPVILAKAGVLKGKKATVWSSRLDRWPIKTLRENGALYENGPVVADGKIVTADGPLAVEALAKKIISMLLLA